MIEPYPGSKEAVEMGCICDAPENQNPGRATPSFWTCPSCPIHGLFFSTSYEAANLDLAVEFELAGGSRT